MDTLTQGQQYLTKTEIHEQYDRHPRTLTGDVNRAIASDDRELLALCQLRTKDGTVIEGVDVKPDTWQRLSSQGENPTWYFLPEFVDVIRTRKKRHRKNNKNNRRGPPSRNAGENPSGISSKDSDNELPKPPFPDDPAIRAIVLEHLHFVEQEHKAANKKLTDKILELVENTQKLQAQTNILVHEAKGLPVQGFQENTTSKDNTTSENSQASTPSGNTNVLDADFESTDDKSGGESSTPQTQSSSKSRKKNTNNSKKARPAGKKTRKPAKETQPTFLQKHLPTLFNRG